VRAEAASERVAVVSVGARARQAAQLQQTQRLFGPGLARPVWRWRLRGLLLVADLLDGRLLVIAQPPAPLPDRTQAMPVAPTSAAPTSVVSPAMFAALPARCASRGFLLRTALSGRARRWGRAALPRGGRRARDGGLLSGGPVGRPPRLGRQTRTSGEVVRYTAPGLPDRDGTSPDPGPRE
jgi:hypothetical protein